MCKETSEIIAKYVLAAMKSQICRLRRGKKIEDGGKVLIAILIVEISNLNKENNCKSIIEARE